MKVIVSKQPLLSALRKVNKSAAKKSRLPILMYVQLSATETGIELATTDLEFYTRTKIIPTTIEGFGGICVPSKLFLDVVNELDKDVEISLEYIENGYEKLHIQQGRSKTTLLGITSMEFPAIPAYEEKLDGIPTKWEVETTRGW